MRTSELIVYVIILVLYTIFAVSMVRNFKTLGGGIFGSGCLIAGGIGIYYIVPPVVTILTEVLKLLLGLLLIGSFIAGLFDS